MFCRNCGKEVIGEAKFCPHCGAQILESAQGQRQTQAQVAAPSPTSPLEFMNPLNGSTYKANIDPHVLLNLNTQCKSDRDYENWIDNLGGLHPMLKDVFKGLIKFTVTAGKIIFHMGKIIVNLVIKLVREYPHTLGGIIAGGVLGMIISNIPLIGWAVGPWVTMTLMAVGGIAGFMEDMNRKIGDAELERRIRSRVMTDMGKLNF